MRCFVPVVLVAALVFAAPAQAQDETEPVTTDVGATQDFTKQGCGGEGGGPPPEPEAATMEATTTAEDECAAAVTRQVTYYCNYKNWAGVTLFRYNSRWRWTTNRGRVTYANHWEFGSHTNLGWRYAGSRYLEPYGAVGTSMVGRTVQGTFELIPGGVYIRSKAVRLRAGVTGSNPYVWGPWCLN